MSLRGNRDISMTEGAVMPALIRYSVPLILAGMLQMLFNAADLAVIGRFADKTATASVGATGAIISLIVSSVIGLSAGVNVILSRSIGAGQREKTVKTVHTAMTAAFVIGFAVMFLGLFVSRFALERTDCPPGALPGAVSYMRIYFLGAPAILVYNFGSAVLRTKGDTRSPLWFMVVSGITNVILNLIFVACFHLDAAGVALATTISQYAAAVLTVVSLLHTEGDCRLDPHALGIRGQELLGILRYGIPSGVNTAVYGITNVLIQTAINSYGESAVSGNAAGSSVEGFLVVGVSSFSTACIAFMGQNIGAGKRDRVKKVFIDSMVFVVGYCLFFGGIGYAFMDRIVAFVYLPGDPAGVENSVIRATYILMVYWVSGVLNILSAGCSSLGYPTAGMINSIATVLTVRLVWMKWVYPLKPSLAMVYLCYPVTWIVTIAVFLVIFIHAVKHYRKTGCVK